MKKESIFSRIKASFNGKSGNEKENSEVKVKSGIQHKGMTGHQQIQNILTHMKKTNCVDEYGSGLSMGQKEDLISIELMEEVFTDKIAENPSAMDAYGKQLFNRYHGRHSESSRPLLEGLEEARKRLGESATKKLFGEMLDQGMMMTEMGKMLHEKANPRAASKENEPKKVRASVERKTILSKVDKLPNDKRLDEFKKQLKAIANSDTSKPDPVRSYLYQMSDNAYRFWASNFKTGQNVRKLVTDAMERDRQNKQQKQ